MEKLCAVLGGTARDADSLTSEETCLYSGSEYGPWVVLVPQDMTSRLARVQIITYRNRDTFFTC